MFVSKQFRNFVQIEKQFNQFLAMAVLKKHMRIQYRFLFLFLKFSKEMCCTSKIKFASLAHERERFFAKVSANRLLRHYCIFAGKLLVRQFCKLVRQFCSYAFPNNFFSKKCCSLKFLLDVVAMF